MFRQALIVSVFAVCVLLAAGSPAWAVSLTYVEMIGRVNTSSFGTVNSHVLFGFGPDPSPVGPDPVPFLGDPRAPVFAWSSPTTGRDPTGHDVAAYNVSLSFDLGGPVTFNTSTSSPDSFGVSRFSINAQMAPGGPVETFDVSFTIGTTGGGLDSLSWVGFDPQPEPPGFPANQTAGFNFLVDPSSVAVTLVLTDRLTSSQATFSVVPEPGTLTLVALGSLIMAIRRRRALRMDEAN